MSWISRLSDELKTHAHIEDSSLAAQQFRMEEVAQHGPALFRALAIEARKAAAALGIHFDAQANWFMAKTNGQPFRMLQAVLDVHEMGIALSYTLGSYRAGENAKVSKDFLDIRVQPPENYLIFLYAGTPVQPQEALETMFRRAFVPQ